jgi:hypothetical protein
MLGTAAVVSVFAFALLWLALGVFLGVRLGERRLLRRMRDLPSTPIPAHLGNTVARSAGQRPIEDDASGS